MRVTPVGPSEAALQAVRNVIPRLPAVRPYLEGTSHRLLSFPLDHAEPDPREKGPALGRLDRFRAVLYDYTNNRAIQVDGPLAPGGRRRHVRHLPERVHPDRQVRQRGVDPGQDLVVWYGAHFTHDVNDTSPDGHSVGPDLVVSSW